MVRVTSTRLLNNRSTTNHSSLIFDIWHSISKKNKKIKSKSEVIHTTVPTTTTAEKKKCLGLEWRSRSIDHRIIHRLRRRKDGKKERVEFLRSSPLRSFISVNTRIDRERLFPVLCVLTQLNIYWTSNAVYRGSIGNEKEGRKEDKDKDRENVNVNDNSIPKSKVIRAERRARRR